MGTSRIEIIDAIRGLAAVCVAFFHAREILWIGIRNYWGLHPFKFTPSSLIAYATFPMAWGSIGVSVFFVVSGYVIHRRVARALVTGNLRFSSSNFLFRRFLRIYPTLIGALFVTYMCDTISQRYGLHYKLGPLDWSTFAWNIVALQGVLARPFGSNFPLWTLAIEIQFYLAYPLCVLLRRRISAINMLFLSFVISLCGYFVLERHGITASPQYFFSWWLGAYIADRSEFDRNTSTWWIPCSVIAILGGCLLMSLGHAFLSFTAWAVGFALLLGYLVGHDALTTRNALWLGAQFVGRFSYSLYAIHMPLIVLGSMILFQGAQEESIYWPFVAVLAVAIFAYGFYVVAERPFIRVLGRIDSQRVTDPAGEQRILRSR